MFENIDENALLNMWPDIEKKPFELYKTTLDFEVDAYHRDLMVNNMLQFLKLFPAHKYKFERSVGAFYIYSEVFQILKHSIYLNLNE